MKRLMYTLAIALLTVSAGFAQKGKGEKLNPAQRAEKHTAVLGERLSLTDAQKKQVLAIQLETQKKASEFRAAAADARKDEAIAHTKFLKAQQVKMNKVLTEDQKIKLKTFRAEEKGKMKNRRNSHKRGPKR